MNDRTIPFKVHPRVFSALGAELVTDDIVAVIELVKNSYDAFANRAMVKLGIGERGSYIAIIDNGQGMDRNTIENIWCTLATPYRLQQPFSQKDDKVRRVTGAKGLGRLSAARLGGYFEMITKSSSDIAWKVSVDWDEITLADGIENCNATIEKYTGELPFAFKSNTGTAIYVSHLSNDWTHQAVVTLKENLARLKSPFSETTDFEILFCDMGEDVPFQVEGEEANKHRITPPEFLLNPKYCIKGQVDDAGTYTATYEYRPIDTGVISREIAVVKEWPQIFQDLNKTARSGLSGEGVTCGPFQFEIRAWDIGRDDILEISERYDMLRTNIRKGIASHKGISVYRDDVLVLPKTDTARDWLRLDLRRVSRVGSRLSTSQIIGYVSLTADGNPGIRDSSDREKLQQTRASLEFEAIILDIIHEFEQARQIDRISTSAVKEKTLTELFDFKESKSFLTEFKQLADEGASASDLYPLIEEHTKHWEEAGEEIVRRFVYYSRLATIGSIAEMLIHEIRNNTTNIGRFLRLIRKDIDTFSENVEKYYLISVDGVERLESLSDTFSPLANREFNGKLRTSVLVSRVNSCIELFIKEINEKSVITAVNIPDNCIISVDPAEIDTIFINLLKNSLYWITSVEISSRRIQISAIVQGNRVHIQMDDTGPGIRDEYVDKVFLPGVTSRNNGIGMGLTVASEIVYQHNGIMSTIHPGDLNGASFRFDLPLKDKK